MIDTFFASGSLDTPAAFLASLLIGVVFGFVLERAGFGSSRRLSGVFYFTDMTVVKVMFSGLITAMLGLVVLRQTGLVTLDNLYFLETVYGAQIVGGLLFGFGFAIGGWCPGTAAAGLGAGKLDALVFLLGAVGGGILFNEAYALVKPLNSVGNQGVQFVYESLGLSLPAFAALFTLLAVAAFWACEWVESRAAGPRDTRILVAFSAALVVAATAVVLMPAGELAARASLSPCATPGQAAPAPAPGVDTPAATSRFLAAIARAEDHVEPEELADGLMSNEPGLLVLDVRTPVEFATFHLRGAEQVELDGLPAFLAARPEARRVVLYSNGMTHPAQARDALQRLGHQKVFILTDGLTGFLERCLTPVSLRDGPVEPGLASRIARWRAHFLNHRSAATGT
jgi:thiosulfate/3-mercaptopyruvate sulfurtransferase